MFKYGPKKHRIWTLFTQYVSIEKMYQQYDTDTDRDESSHTHTGDSALFASNFNLLLLFNSRGEFRVQLIWGGAYCKNG